MTDRLRCWNERVHGACAAHPAPATLPESDLPSTPLLTVVMPANGLRMTPEALVDVILAQTENNDVDLISRPSPELVASRKRSEVCHGWKAWGPLCLVCHCDVPEGQAVAYPFVFGSRACIDSCADLVSDLLRIYDRSPRGRWRPTRDVHTKSNGVRCHACKAVPE